MLRFQVIGCGAAGNKATINLVESEVLNKDEFSYLLINSTSKDIPANYREKALIFGKSLGGCGKERDIAKDMIIHDEDNGIRALDKMVDPYADVVIVCGSTEGGTGSASVPMISKYISSVLKQPVIASSLASMMMPEECRIALKSARNFLRMLESSLSATLSS